jgi:hypothetical protein
MKLTKLVHYILRTVVLPGKEHSMFAILIFRISFRPISHAHMSNICICTEIFLNAVSQWYDKMSSSLQVGFPIQKQKVVSK